MIQYPVAIQKIKYAAEKRKNVSSELLDLIAAEGRILSEEIHSPEAVPSFDNSSMDGFAVNSAQCKPGVNQFKVVKQIFAGDRPEVIASENIAVEIMTGAPMPGRGFDAVVKVEDTITHVNEKGVRIVELKGPVSSGQFVRYLGEDFKKGNLIATPGTRVDSKLLMSCAAVGLSRLPVFRKPKVWVLATGKEVMEYDAGMLTPGQIRNSSSPYLVNELKRMGCEVFYQGIFRDDPAEFEDCLKTALAEKVELIISTGAVSMGIHDFARESVEKVGGTTNFHKVAIRPGKPVLFAEFKNQDPTHSGTGTVFFGLPGNPISTAVGVQFFVKPYLDVLFCTDEKPVYGVLVKDAKKPEGLRCFFKAHWWVDASGKSCVEVLEGQASFMIHSLVKANAWVVLPEEASEVSAGSVLEIYPLL
jgi:molybdopterin molybdotransferase